MKEWPVVITAAAEADLERIGDRIAKRNPSRAVTFVRELRRQCVYAGKAPKAFGCVKGLEDYGIRKMSFGDYVVLYVMARKRVEILHVSHGAQDYLALLLMEFVALA